MDVRKNIRLRVYIAFTGICLFGLAIIVKAAMIQTFEGKKLRTIPTSESHIRFDTLIAERGSIYSEDGVLLSTSIPVFDVYLDFSVIRDTALFNHNLDSLSECLSAIFTDKTSQQYKKELIQAYEEEEDRYHVGKKLQFNQYDLLRNLPIFRRGKGYGGIIETSKSKRSLPSPYDKIGFCAVGSFRDSNKTGLESQYDKYLSGINGRRLSQKQNLNSQWKALEGTEIEAQNGKDIVTTIDLNLQNVAEDSLMSVMKKFDCIRGTCIVMEVKTGKIKALANLGLQKDGSYLEDYNYALYPTEPGSTFKLVTLLSLLNDRKINVNDTVDAEGGVIFFKGQAMKDSHLGLHKMPIWKAFAESSNAAFAKLANNNYGDKPRKFIDHMVKLGLNNTTGIDLPKELKPKIITPDSSGWNPTSLPWMATGYVMKISPMQTCMIYNAIANKGKMMKPYLLSSVKEYGRIIKTVEPTVLAENITESGAYDQIMKCLKAVVTNGTAHDIQSPYYTIAGKTGTAKVADKGITYNDKVYQGSFVGFIPAEEPKYTICVVLRTKPNSKNYYGSLIAAPVFRKVADKIFSLNMGGWDDPLDSLSKIKSNTIPAKLATGRAYEILLNGIQKHKAPSGDYMDEMMHLTTDSISKHIAMQPTKLYKNLVPDVSGMGLKDAVYMLESGGLRVQVVGKGKVQSQSIPAGTKIIKGQNITLQLS